MLSCAACDKFQHAGYRSLFSSASFIVYTDLRTYSNSKFKATMEIQLSLTFKFVIAVNCYTLHGFTPGRRGEFPQVALSSAVISHKLVIK